MIFVDFLKLFDHNDLGDHLGLILPSRDRMPSCKEFDQRRNKNPEFHSACIFVGKPLLVFSFGPLLVFSFGNELEGLENRNIHRFSFFRSALRFLLSCRCSILLPTLLVEYYTFTSTIILCPTILVFP
jgi:hypothetical protein